MHRGVQKGVQPLDRIKMVVTMKAYYESHESDPPEISDGFKEMGSFLKSLPLDDNNAVFTLCCRLCAAYERKAFHNGLLYGAY